MNFARWKHPALLVLGWLFVALGFVGLLLPVVPTTPFLIVALWAFSTSSRRMHDWLYHHRVLGPPLQEWHRHRVIPLRAKLFTFAAMAGSLGYAALVERPPWPWLAAMAAIMGAGAIYVASKPSRPPPAATPAMSDQPR